MARGYINHYMFKKNRLIILKKANNKCSRCNEEARVVHHKDHTKSNHHLDNLEALCCKCHTQHHIKTAKEQSKKTGDPLRISRPCHTYKGKIIRDIAREIGCSFTTIKTYIKGTRTKYDSQLKKVFSENITLTSTLKSNGANHYVELNTTHDSFTVLSITCEESEDKLIAQENAIVFCERHDFDLIKNF